MRWEYEASDYPRRMLRSELQRWVLQRWLNKRGADGWELVGFYFRSAIWKRQIKVSDGGAS